LLSRGDHQHHESHRRISLMFRLGAGCQRAKAAVSCIWRISLSPSPAILRKRSVNATASAFDLTSMIAKPAISSLLSVKGPSVSVIFPLDRRTRAQVEPDGRR